MVQAVSRPSFAGGAVFVQINQKISRAWHWVTDLVHRVIAAVKRVFLRPVAKVVVPLLPLTPPALQPINISKPKTPPPEPFTPPLAGSPSKTTTPRPPAPPQPIDSSGAKIITPRLLEKEPQNNGAVPAGSSEIRDGLEEYDDLPTVRGVAPHIKRPPGTPRHTVVVTALEQGTSGDTVVAPPLSAVPEVTETTKKTGLLSYFGL